MDSVIDTILQSNRQGRNLEGYDKLYADPEVKNILQVGNDSIARVYIKDKLCSLGLMNVSYLLLEKVSQTGSTTSLLFRSSIFNLGN